jgi:hypothetical protein
LCPELTTSVPSTFSRLWRRTQRAS